jgi:GxxExxY protein
MDLIREYNARLEPMRIITGVAMKVHAKYRSGLLESAYEAAMEYLLKNGGHSVERQKELPIFWDDVQLDQSYRMDLVIDGIIVELKSVSHTTDAHVRQLWNYMHLTHTEYGMLINFGSERLYSAWYRRDPLTREIEKVKLM